MVHTRISTLKPSYAIGSYEPETSQRSWARISKRSLAKNSTPWHRDVTWFFTGFIMAAQRARTTTFLGGYFGSFGPSCTWYKEEESEFS